MSAAAGGCRLTLHIQPGAARSGIAGVHGDALKLRVHAPAVDGAANSALLAYLVERLKLSARQVKIERGEKSRRKIVWVALPPCDVWRQLSEDLA